MPAKHPDNLYLKQKEKLYLKQKDEARKEKKKEGTCLKIRGLLDRMWRDAGLTGEPNFDSSECKKVGVCWEGLDKVRGYLSTIGGDSAWSLNLEDYDARKLNRIHDALQSGKFQLFSTNDPRLENFRAYCRDHNQTRRPTRFRSLGPNSGDIAGGEREEVGLNHQSLGAIRPRNHGRVREWRELRKRIAQRDQWIAHRRATTYL